MGMAEMPGRVMLFPEVVDRSSDPRAYGERCYDFLARVTQWPEMEAARKRMEAWYSHLSDERQVKLRRTMSEGTEPQFAASFFELLLHEFILASDYYCADDPEPREGERVPDFVVMAPGGTRVFILEATVATDKSDSARSRERLAAPVLDGLNAIPAPHISLAVRELVLKTDAPPALAELKAFVAARLAGVRNRDGAGPGTTWTYEDENLRVQLSPVWLRRKTRKTNIGMLPVQCRWGGAEASIQRKLEKKATRYGALDAPFVVAANVTSEWAGGLEEVTQVLLGITETRLQRGVDCDWLRQSAHDSFWYAHGKPRHRGVSAVLATSVYPWSVPRAHLRLYHNPWADQPLP